MLRRLRGLFARYRDAHRRLKGRGFTLRDAKGRMIGHVDAVLLEGNRATFEGWTLASQISLYNSGGKITQVPNLMRQDVAQIHGCSPFVGFYITRAYGTGRFTLAAHLDGTTHDHHVAPFRRLNVGVNTLFLGVQFLAKLITLTPALLAWALRRDPAARARIKDVLNLHHAPDAAVMRDDLFAPTDAPQFADTSLSIVLPVYNAFDLLPEVLDRVVRHTDLPWHLIMIEDGSSDARVRPWLSAWAAERAHGVQACAAPGTVELIENPENLGFIGAVNRGLERALERGDPVVLLNSDAFVPAGWASRLLQPMLVETDVATVTPMSNDAEIFSVPAICTRTPLAPGQADAIDAVARQISPEAGQCEAPTGVGFCMAVNPDYLRKLPALDTIFGRGYGEEVDWCQKARTLGGRHVGVANLFVEHRGGESFGSDAKAALVAANNEIVATRYPRYDAEVQQFIAADPLIGGRVALAIAWAVAETETRCGAAALPIYLAHALGGGADTYLEDRIARDLDATGLPAIILRVGGPYPWQIEVVSTRGRCSGGTDDLDLVHQLLAPVTRRHIVYSCGVGAPHPGELPPLLLDLHRAETDRLEVLVHDFFMITPGYTLLDSTGHFRPADALDPADSAHQARASNGTLLTLTQWQAAWGALLEAADEIVTFSHDSAHHITSVYPQVAPRLVHRPHALLTAVPRLTAPETDTRTIAVLGNIGFHKGLEVVIALAEALANRRDARVLVMGRTDPAYTLPPALTVHGGYSLEELPELARRYGITDWLIPSIWPETFSYTTHEALATGLPTYAFALGAQGDAVAAAENGHPVPFGPEGAEVDSLLASLGLTETTPPAPSKERSPA